MVIKHQKSDSDRFYLCNSRLDHRNYGCSCIRVGGDKPRLGRSKHKCQVQPQVKKKRPPSTAARPGGCDQAHSPRPSISFPGTNYPDVRDLTHKLQTAGEFSGSNHTSVLLAPNNPQCLTHPPPSPPDSVSINFPAPAPGGRPVSPGPSEGKNQPTLARETGARLMISSRNCHQLLFFFLTSLSSCQRDGMKEASRPGRQMIYHQTNLAV